MAQDPNGIRTDRYLPSAKDWPEDVTLPSGVTKDDAQFYLHETIYNDGRRVLEWRKRGTGGTKEAPDDQIVGTVNVVAQAVKDEFTAAQAKGDQEGDIRASSGPTREVFRGGRWVVEPNPVYQTPAAQQEDWHTEGTPDGQGGTDNSRPIMVRTVNGQRQTRQPTAKELEDWQLAAQMTRNPGGLTDAQIRAQAEKDRPQLVPGTLNTTSPRQGVIDPATAQVTWTPNPNYQNPDPKPVAIPGNPRNVIWDDGPGKPLRTEKNPLYEVPHKVSFDQQSGKWIDITEDDNGKQIIKDVPREIAIKPAELPVLQARYGEIATGLGKIAQDLNAKHARGEITEQQRDAAWKAAHAQAETQVSEINSILENSKAVWSGQVTQRGQSLNETQSRRSFAESMAGRAMSTGQAIASRSGKGSGEAIAGGVAALMRMGQRYAEGMGGFRESPEIALPAALQQAQGIGLPGYPMPGSTPSVPLPGGAAAGPPAGGPNALGLGAVIAMPAPVGPPPPGSPQAGVGISNTTDAGGIPREYTPASSTVGSGMPPMVPGMGSALGAADGYGGAPVAAGGGGMFDPNLAAQGMLGQGGDPAWEEAVRRAAQAHAQQGYGR